MKHLSVWFLLVAFLLLLTGCWGEPPAQDEEDETAPWLTDELSPPQPSIDTTLPVSFSLPYHRDQSLDPIICNTDIQANVAALLYEPLFSLDSAMEPQPVLCSDWEHNEDWSIWTLSVQEGVLFSDGSELTAADAASMLRRAASSERYSYRFRNVLSVTLNRSQQIVITLSSPNSGFLSLLDIPIVKSGSEKNTIPIGTGPYIYVTGDGEAWLTPNSEWWKGGKPPVDRIELIHAKDLDVAIALFSSRQVQLCSTDLTGTQTISLTGSISCQDAPSTTMQFIGINCSHPQLSDPAVRRALMAGIQQDQVIQRVLSGHAQAAQFPISPASTLYPAALDAEYRYENFADAMKEAGLNTQESQLHLTMIVNKENSFKIAAANYLAETLSEFDLTVEVLVLPWAEYTAALAEGNFDLYYGEVRMTADWDLSQLIGSTGTLNYGRYSSWKTDLLISSFHSSNNRKADFHSLCEELAEEAPILPICFKNYSVLTHEGVVDGLQPTAANVFHDPTGWSVNFRPEAK